MTEPGSDVSRWHWGNWPVLVKLIAVLLVPTVVALVVGVLRIVDQAGAAPTYTRISQIADVQQKLSDLVGAVQRERDLATVFVATGRSGDRVPLDQQFGAVDARTGALRSAADQVEDLRATGYPAILDDLRALRPLRQSVLAGSGPVQVVIAEYGAAIDPLIELDSALVRQLDDVAVTDDAAATHALLVAREQVNGQHAVILAALYANRIAASQIDDVRAAAVRLDTATDEFSAALQPAERATRITQAFGDAELSRQRLMQLVLNRGLANNPLDISPSEWTARTAATAESITGVSDELRRRIDRTALALRDDARAAAGWNAVILIFALGLGVLVGILIARSMLGPLVVLKRTALEVAGRRLPDAMARVRDGDMPDEAVEPVAVGTREEIGQVARAFDEVHLQAIRLAGEQAKLRAHVNDIFVNLSRRSQSLVERQLQLIDRLESGEQDPEQLDNLFQLDHLATRMRRNSDNLLVLAGTEAAKRAGRPVRLVDVLRAAVSEVEQYQRLVLQQPPGVLVLGRAAGDLVHLLAELLDNATQLSPPDTHVMVSAEYGADGSVAIEVMDRGVGMTDAEVDEANDRLASTPVVDASVSRRMGLFVVGRLAIRHGIQVRLRRGDDGIGICASVGMPPRLVRSVSDGAEPRAVSAGSPGPPEPPALPGAGAATEPAARTAAGTGAAMVSGELLNGLGGHRTNGNGTHPSTAPSGTSGTTDPPPGGALPRRPGNRSVPAASPPESSGPQVQPRASTPGGGSGSDLFRPGGLRSGTPSTTSAPSGPSSQSTLQHSTPIFDDVASAWFREHQDGPPVRWSTGQPATEQAGQMPAESDNGEPAADPDTATSAAQPGSSPAAASPPETSPPGSAEPEAAEPEAAEPGISGSGVSESGVSAPDPASEASAPVQEPVPAAAPVGAPTGARQPAADAAQQDWGAGDHGWRAAQALAQPEVSGEVTAAGLPRRTPRALLVPGAAGPAEPVAPTSGAPVRDAEFIRGRLSSYQQGIREGRLTRRSTMNGSYQQQDAEEETK